MKLNEIVDLKKGQEHYHAQIDSKRAGVLRLMSFSGLEAQVDTANVDHFLRYHHGKTTRNWQCWAL